MNTRRQEKIYKLKKHPDNPRVIKDVKYSKLVKSIKEFPEMLEKRPLVVTKDLVVLGGNMRLRAAKDAGLKEIWIDETDWSEEKQREFIIKDNSGFGEWDFDALANDWDVHDLNDWGLDLPPMFDEPEPEATEDDYTEPDNMQVDVVLGDLIEIGEHRLLCGDSTNSDEVSKLMNGEKADMVFTSPPYNANTTLNGKKLYLNNTLDNKTEKDYLNFLDDIKNAFIPFLKSKGFVCWNIMYNNNSRSAFIKNVNNFINSNLLLDETVIWKKNAIPLSAGLARAFEFIFIFQKDVIDRTYKKKHDYVENVWEISNANTQIKGHNACYPVKLPSKGIEIFTDLNMNVFDPFLGSGTTMVAAHQLKRKCYGMELDPKYCQVIIDRMQKLDSELQIKINGKIYEKTEYVL